MQRLPNLGYYVCLALVAISIMCKKCRYRTFCQLFLFSCVTYPIYVVFLLQSLGYSCLQLWCKEIPLFLHNSDYQEIYPFKIRAKLFWCFVAAKFDLRYNILM